jgi:hypothetical protein
MADNTKMPPNQDQRRAPQGDNNQKQGGSVPTGSNPGTRPGASPGKPTPEMDPDRGRQGVTNPAKSGPEMDPDRARPDRNKPGAPGKPGEKIDVDDDEDMPIDRE